MEQSRFVLKNQSENHKESSDNCSSLALGEKLSLRKDDQPEVVARRLENYEALMKPILEYYVCFSPTPEKEIHLNLMLLVIAKSSEPL